MRLNRILQAASTTLFLLTLFAQAASAQTAPSWEILRPEGEEFSILMPKDPVIDAGKMPYHKMELNTRSYFWTSPATPTVAVVSMSGIKSNPAMYSDMERLNSYVDAFKKFFVPKVTAKETATKFVLVGPKVLNGNAGREYQVTIGDRSGTAQVFATRKRFYAIVFLANKKADELRNQFLSSFTLPEFVAKPVETVTAERQKAEQALDEAAIKQQKNEKEREANAAGAATPGNANAQGGAPGDPKAADTAHNRPSENPADPNSSNPGSTRKPISGGVLNGKALFLPQPNYPQEARSANASGAVTVQVIIDEFGNVINAEVASGHPLLRQVALSAALQAKFSPTTLMGEPVKVAGVLIYNFVKQ
jgi:TonB family protein